MSRKTCTFLRKLRQHCRPKIVGQDGGQHFEFEKTNDQALARLTNGLSQKKRAVMASALARKK